MSDDGADDRILKLGFVKVDDDIHVFFLDQLCYRVASFFGQSPVCPARPCPVQVPDVHVSQLLTAGIVDVDLRVRPLVERI